MAPAAAFCNAFQMTCIYMIAIKNRKIEALIARASAAS